MNELVRKIIELDKDGQEQIRSLEKEKAELSDQIKKMRATLTQKTKEETDAIIVSIKEQLDLDYQTRLHKAQEDAQRQENSNAILFEAHKVEWLDELVKFCLETEASQ